MFLQYLTQIRLFFDPTHVPIYPSTIGRLKSANLTQIRLNLDPTHLPIFYIVIFFAAFGGETMSKQHYFFAAFGGETKQYDYYLLHYFVSDLATQAMVK